MLIVWDVARLMFKGIRNDANAFPRRTPDVVTDGRRNGQSSLRSWNRLLPPQE